MFSFINSVCVLLLVGHKLFSFTISACVLLLVGYKCSHSPFNLFGPSYLADPSLFLNVQF